MTNLISHVMIQLCYVTGMLTNKEHHLILNCLYAKYARTSLKLWFINFVVQILLLFFL